MEISTVVGQQYAFLLPGLVIICAVLVFAFGFKTSVEPPNFKHLSLSSDEKKSIKKRKIKEKKPQTNGHATVIMDDNEGKKQDYSVKPLKQSNKGDINKAKKNEESEKLRDNKKDAQKLISKANKKSEKKTGKENQENPRVKKNVQKTTDDKPSDFDEGEWETAFSRKDKKNKKKEDENGVALTPEKTPKKKSGEKNQKQDKANKEESVNKSKIEASNLQNKTPKPASSPVSQKAGETTDKKKKLEKKNKTSPIAEEKILVIEPKPQCADSKEKKQVDTTSPTKIGKLKESKKFDDSKLKTGSATEQPEHGAVFDEVDEYWKEAPPKKGKKKVRKD